MNWFENGVIIEGLPKTEVLKLLLIFIKLRPPPPDSLLGWIEIEGVFPIYCEDMRLSAFDTSEKAGVWHISYDSRAGIALVEVQRSDERW